MIPDTRISQLDERFSGKSAVAYQLSALLPAYANDFSFDVIAQAASFYGQFLTDSGENRAHSLAKLRQPVHVKRPDSVTDAMKAANDLETYSALSALLRVHTTLPVTTATGKRSVSALKHIKQLEDVVRKYHVMVALTNVGVEKRRAVLRKYKADVYEAWQLWLERGPKSSVIPFLVPCRKVWLTPTAGVPCSNAANIG